MLRRLRPAFLAAVSVLSLAVTAFVVAGPAAAAVPRTPSGLPRAIEPLAPYEAQVSCDPRTRPGTAALARLLTATYRGTSYNTTYACGTDGTVSEHYDGRAIDWMVSVRNATQYADAKAAISWLLGTDRAGNRFAMARRLGVQYLIYNNRMWGAWDGRWEDYNGCSHLPQRGNDNACHRTHMHISLDWDGAMGRTTFWAKRVYATDWGPCRRTGLNWAPLYQRANFVGCPGLPSYSPARGASATKVALVRYSGVAMRWGYTGPAVTAVQQALHVRATGRYDGPTNLAIKHFQAAHAGCPVTGAMNVHTWWALLRAVR